MRPVVIYVGCPKASLRAEHIFAHCIAATIINAQQRRRDNLRAAVKSATTHHARNIFYTICHIATSSVCLILNAGTGCNIVALPT